MGALFFIALNVMMVIGLRALFKSKMEREKLWQEIKAKPFQHIYLLVWLVGIMAFGWGILSQGHFSMLVETPLGDIQSWALGGLIGLAGLVLFFFIKL